MAMFVHLAPESKEKTILRSGIARSRRVLAEGIRGVFAVPMTRNFFISHQWLRDLKRGRPGPMVGIYFRIPDVETVFASHYNSPKIALTASEASALFANEESDREGFEVVVPRRIEASEIHRTRRLPQVVGWRYRPGSHGTIPCGCSFCQRGRYGAKRLRDRFENGE